MNLLQEAKRILEKHGKTLPDVLWVGTKTDGVVINNPIEDLLDVYYDDWDCHNDLEGITDELILVGDDWWLELNSDSCYGAWWGYKTLPKKPRISVKVGSIEDIKEW